MTSDPISLFLSRLNDCQRLPRGWHKSLTDAQSAPKDSDDEIFLTEGPATWLAYVLVKNSAENSMTFHGKADFRRVLADLLRSSIQDRRTMARELSVRIPSQTQKKINETVSSVMVRHRSPCEYSVENLTLILT